MYGTFKGDKKDRCWVVRSKDRGSGWTFISTIAEPDPSIGSVGFNEPVMAPLPNGELLCVMGTGSGEPLYQCKSNDNGETWSKPVPLGM